MEVEAKDVGVAFGSITQISALGWLIGHRRGSVTAERASAGRPQDSCCHREKKRAALLRSTSAIADFTLEEKAATAQSYGEAFHLQNKVMLGFGAEGLLASLGAWKRKPVEFVEIKEKRRRDEGEIVEDETANGGANQGVVLED